MELHLAPGGTVLMVSSHSETEPPEDSEAAARRFGFAPVQLRRWQPAVPDEAYGEDLIGLLLAALQQLDPAADVGLVLPSPQATAPAARALALGGVEALRRFGNGRCAWPESPHPAATWKHIGAHDVDALLSTLFAGLSNEASPVPRTSKTMGSDSVSVIVRSMDRSSLAHTLESIAAQTHPSVEVVIVNARGAAHAPLPQRCGAFPVVVAAAQGQPLRRSAAANHGLLAARGTSALFLDDDDVLLPDHLSRLARALHDRPEAIAAYAGVEMGHTDAGHWQPAHRFDAPFDATRLLFENYLPMHAVLFRRNAATAALRLDEQFDLFEDWDWWLQLATLGAFVHVPGVSARYRMTGSEQSEVFAGTPAAAQARARLVEKWRLRIGEKPFGELVSRAQELFREAAQLRDQLELAQRGEAYQREVVEARERDLAEGERMRQGQMAVLAARERELSESARELAALREAQQREAGEARRHAADLQAIVAEREREIASLRALLQTREREQAEAAEHAANLAGTIAAREDELTHLSAHAAELGKIVAARDTELASQAYELQQLRAETLPQAVKRILRKKDHGSHRG